RHCSAPARYPDIAVWLAFCVRIYRGAGPDLARGLAVSVPAAAPEPPAERRRICGIQGSSPPTRRDVGGRALEYRLAKSDPYARMLHVDPGAIPYRSGDLFRDFLAARISP